VTPAGFIKLTDPELSLKIFVFFPPVKITSLLDVPSVKNTVTSLPGASDNVGSEKLEPPWTES